MAAPTYLTVDGITKLDKNKTLEYIVTLLEKIEENTRP